MSERTTIPITPELRRKMFGYWKEISASLSSDVSERETRISYVAGKVGHPIASWNDLTAEEAIKVIRAMRDDLGRNGSVGYDPDDPVSPDALEIIENIAREMYGEKWYTRLLLRLKSKPYFHEEPLNRISPRQSHALIEELLDHWERQLNPDEAPIKVRKERKENLRARFGKKAQAVLAPRRRDTERG